MGRPRKGDHERMRQEIPELLEQGLNSYQIAAQFGYNHSSLKTLCSKMGISLRPPQSVARGADDVEEHKLAFSRRVMDKYRREAEKRNIDVEYLVHLLLKRIADDYLFRAVLDDD